MASVVANDLRGRQNSNFRLRLRRHCVIAIYGLTVVYGFVLAAGQFDGAFYMFFAAAYASAFTLWAVNDSRIRGRPMYRISEELFFFSWPVATLIYSVGTRRWKGLGQWLAHAIGLYVTLLLAYNGRILLLRWIS